MAYTWTEYETLPSNTLWNSAGYFNGVWVAARDTASPFVWWSDDDGATWTQASTQPDQGSSIAPLCITNDGTQFILNRTTDHVFTSTDGDSWTFRSRISNTTLQNWRQVAYSGSTYVGINRQSSSTARYSSNLTTTPWSAGDIALINSANAMQSVAYGGGKFVAVGFNGRIAYSDDGASWTELAARFPDDTMDYVSVVYGGGKFVAIGIGDYTENVAVSSDGVNWTSYSTPVGTSGYFWLRVLYDGNQFVAVAETVDEIIVSTDGQTWTVESTPTSVNGWYGSATDGSGRIMLVSYGDEGSGKTKHIIGSSVSPPNEYTLTTGAGSYSATGHSTSLRYSGEPAAVPRFRTWHYVPGPVPRELLP